MANVASRLAALGLGQVYAVSGNEINALLQKKLAFFFHFGSSGGPVSMTFVETSVDMSRLRRQKQSSTTPITPADHYRGSRSL